MVKQQATSVFNIGEAKAILDEIMERAHRGEEIIIAKRGRPWARFVPLGNDLDDELPSVA